MRKSLIIIGLTVFGLAIAIDASAQQDPYYTHFKFNKQAHNAGAVGTTDDVICVSGVMHSQWRNYNDYTFVDRQTGEPVDGGEIIENVAPVTYNFNIGGQISKNKGTKQIGALGASVYSDKLGFTKATSFRVQAAYFIPIQGNFGRLSVGLEFGMHQFGFDNPRFRAFHPNDPKIPKTDINDSKFDLGAGLYYKQRRLGNNIENFYAGFSITHLTQPTFDLVTLNPQLEMHTYGLAGADVRLSPAMVLEPAIWFKYKAKPQFDVNATVLYNDMLRGGVGYRQGGISDALSIMLGYKMQLTQTSVLQLGYSYDITLSGIREVSDGTHEFMVTYCFPLVVNPPEEKKFYHRNTRWL